MTVAIENESISAKPNRQLSKAFAAATLVAVVAVGVPLSMGAAFAVSAAIAPQALSVLASGLTAMTLAGATGTAAIEIARKSKLGVFGKLTS